MKGVPAAYLVWPSAVSCSQCPPGSRKKRFDIQSSGSSLLATHSVLLFSSGTLQHFLQQLCVSIYRRDQLHYHWNCFKHICKQVVRVHTLTHSHSHTHAHTHTRTHARTHTHTHTHTHSLPHNDTPTAISTTACLCLLTHTRGSSLAPPSFLSPLASPTGTKKIEYWPRVEGGRIISRRE